MESTAPTEDGPSTPCTPPASPAPATPRTWSANYPALAVDFFFFAEAVCLADPTFEIFIRQPLTNKKAFEN
jgi:hypothetical protein